MQCPLCGSFEVHLFDTFTGICDACRQYFDREDVEPEEPRERKVYKRDDAG